MISGLATTINDVTNNILQSLGKIQTAADTSAESINQLTNTANNLQTSLDKTATDILENTTKYVQQINSHTVGVLTSTIPAKSNTDETTKFYETCEKYLNIIANSNSQIISNNSQNSENILNETTENKIIYNRLVQNKTSDTENNNKIFDVNFFEKIISNLDEKLNAFKNEFISNARSITVYTNTSNNFSTTQNTGENFKLNTPNSNVSTETITGGQLYVQRPVPPIEKQQKITSSVDPGIKNSPDSHYRRNQHT